MTIMVELIVRLLPRVILFLSFMTICGSSCPLLENTTFACHEKLETAREVLRYLPELLPNTTILDFSRNLIQKLEKDEFKTVEAALLAVNVSHNQITEVEVGAFNNLSQLKVLDLSYNQLRIVSIGSFQGLSKLQKLFVSNNPITQIQERSFDVLPSLKELDISGTPLICDCHLTWLSDRVRQGKLILLQDVSTTCFTPLRVRGRRFSTLQTAELTCSSNPDSIELHRLDISPSRDQIVVPGDNFSMECSATNVLDEGGTHMMFEHNNGLPGNVSIKFRLTDDKGTLIGQLNITQVSLKHNGVWKCHVWTSRNNQSVTRTLQVLDPAGVKCPTNHTVTTRGSFYWPETLALGQIIAIPCDEDSRYSPSATHVCGSDGRWQALNVSQCGLRSEFARVMREYVKRISEQTTLESATYVPDMLKTYLLNETTDRVILDADHVDLVLQALEAILRHTEGSAKTNLHSDILPIVNWLLNTSYPIFEEGQQRLSFSQRIVKIILTASSLMTGTGPTSLKHFALNVVSVHRDKDTFCQIKMEDVAILDCSSISDRTASIFSDTVKITKDGSWEGKVLVLAFRNVKLFAAALDKVHAPTSAVLGVFPLGDEIEDFKGKWTVELQASGLSEQSSVWAFSERMAEITDRCKEVERMEDTRFVVVECNHFGAFVTITQPLNVWMAHHSGDPKSSGAIPLVILMGCVTAVIVHISLMFLYAIYFSEIVLDRVYKHSLLNIWTAVSALLLLYGTAFNYSPNRSITSIIAFVLHYLTLAVFTWLFLGFYTIFRHRRTAVARQTFGYSPQRMAAMQGLLETGLNETTGQGARAQAGTTEGVRARISLGGLYLFGWGIPALVSCLAAFLHSNTKALDSVNVYLFLLPVVIVLLLSIILYFCIVSCRMKEKKNISNESFDGGKLGYIYHANVLLFYSLLFSTTVGLIAVPYWLKDFVPSQYMVLVFLLVWNVEALVVFWLVRKDLPKSCWRVSKVETNATRTVIPLQHTVYAPLPSQNASVFQNGKQSFVTDGGPTSSYYDNMRTGQHRPNPSLADSSRLGSSMFIPAPVPKIETRI